MTDLRSAARDPSWVPARSELPALLDLLASDDDQAAAERALSRAGRPAIALAIARFDASRPPVRGRLVKVVARAAASADPEVVRFLTERLSDADAKTRRNAVVALGKVPADDAAARAVEAALVGLLDREPRVEHRRSIAASLGKIGGARALEALRALDDAGDAELLRIRAEAVLKLERTLARDERGAIDATVAPRDEVHVRFHCKRGLEDVLEEELRHRVEDEVHGPRIVGPGVVEARLAGPLAALHRARTFMRFGFPLPVVEAPTVEERVARTLASDVTFALLSRLSRGPITWRLEWAGAGHRRASTYRCATRVAELRPELRNDPRASLWEAIVVERKGALDVEIWPKALDDPRFSYRLEDVPASSHPTVAAALARVAGVRRDEVVWDPFVGAGTELVERALVAPVRALYGSDVDARAIAAARKNLAAAGLAAVLAESDARASRPPEKVSLVLTNPPMGKRVLERRALEPLFEGLFENVAGVLRRDGRVVLLSPLFARSIEIARRNGLFAVRRGVVDLGGIEAELQVFERGR